MAMQIIDGCIACAACEPECPNQAISAGDPLFLIDAARCTECVGAHDTPKCIDVCPIDGCIVVDAALAESREMLEQKYQALHA
ncbi:MAG: YfhL family 4Fe-4S dicluster ferredoxin [Vicinamibacteria bacterium]|nr:YfhL family 4Fe-4S dicluster ferredoxin [Vicinamibacteria bacterium]